MKFYFIFTMILFLSMVINAQQSLVVMNPSEGQGYLLLKNDPNITDFEITYIHRNYSNESTYTSSNLETVSLIGKNYLRVDNTYLNSSNTYINVAAHYSDGTTVSEEIKANHFPTQVLGQEYEMNGFWSCNGSTYAWWIGYYSVYQGQNHQLIGSYFKLEHGLKVPKGNYSTVGSGNMITNWNNLGYYYQYFSEVQFQNLINNPNWKINGIPYMTYYGISDLNFYKNHGYPQPEVVKLKNSNIFTYKTANGSPIYSTYVYGIKKGLGPWSGSTSNGCLQTSLLPMGPSAMVNPISYAINTINTNSQSNPQNCNKSLVSCNQSITPFNFFPDPPVPVKDLKVKIDSIIWPWEILEKINLIYHESNTTNWESNYYELQFSKVSGNSSKVFDVLLSDLYDNNGNKIETPINLPPGLYNIGVILSGGRYISFISEVENSSNNTTITLSDYLTKTIYPVPITEDNFNISLSATQGMSVIYKLFDFNMNLLYETTFEIAEGSSETINIDPGIPLNSGILVNQFIFEDGSQSTVLTTKSNQ